MSTNAVLALVLGVAAALFAIAWLLESPVHVELEETAGEPAPAADAG